MIYFIYGLNFSLMIVMPVILARIIDARLKPGWRYFGMGAVTFVLSQVLHIPLNWLALQRFKFVPTDDLMALAIFVSVRS